MKTNPNPVPPISEDDALTELTSILPAGDRVRFAALGQVSTFAAARQRSLLRQEKMLVARHGADSPEAKSVRQRLEVEKRFGVATRAEAQRTQTEPVSRNPDALTLTGRVVNPQRVAMPRLTVSATDEQGKPVVFTATNATGHFVLAVPATAESAGLKVRLLVSDDRKAVLYRGQECFAREPRKVYFRELVFGTAAPETEPTPPPEIDPKSVTVPDVRGLEEGTARAQIRAVGLTVESTEKESGSENVGRVIEQKPRGGAQVAPCSLVKIVVGSLAKVQVPNVVGLTLREAQAKLKEAQLAVGRIDPADATLQSKVVQQSPAAGSDVPPKTTVDLVVQEPIPQVTVPNVVQLKLGQAREVILKAALKVGAIEPAGASEESLVLEQSPKAQSRVDTGTPVNLKVEERKPTAVVPNVIRRTLAQAKGLLAEAKLQVGKVSPGNASATSVVLKQTPRAGTEVDQGTAVDLAVQEPTPQQPVPNVVKLKLGEAREVLAKAELKVGALEPENAPATSIVIEQSPSARTSVVAGTPVNLKLRVSTAKRVVPNVIRSTLAEAKAALAEARLRVGEVKPENAPAASVIRKQAPQAGAQVDEGTAVDLFLRAPSDTRPEPASNPVLERRTSKPKRLRKKKKKKEV
jgi:beta-lactam-binding protein with PASTA domain